MNATTEHRYPLQFFGVVFLLSVPFWLFGSFVSKEFLPGLPVSSTMVVCPMIAGAFLVWRSDGVNSLLAFLKEAVYIIDMRFWVWAVAFGTMPLVMLGSALILIGSGKSLPAPEIDIGQALMLFVLFFVAATAEELGWTGYATRPLVQRHGLIVASLIIGVIAVVWHIVPLLQADRGYDWIAWWAVGTVSRRGLIVWLYVKGGQRVFAASLFHAMSNTSWMLFPIMGSHYDPASSAIILLCLVVLVASVEGNTGKIDT